MLTKDGDLGDEARYIFCAPFEGVCVRDVVDVGVEGREFEAEVTVLVEVDGDVDRGEEVPTFLKIGGLLVDDVPDNGLPVLAAVLGDEQVVFISFFVLADGFCESLLFAAASYEEEPSFRFDGGVKLLNLTPPIFFSPLSFAFLRISSISGEVYLSSSFLWDTITGDSPRFCLEDKLSKYLEGLVESGLGKNFK